MPTRCRQPVKAGIRPHPIRSAARENNSMPSGFPTTRATTTATANALVAVSACSGTQGVGKGGHLEPSEEPPLDANRQGRRESKMISLV